MLKYLIKTDNFNKHLFDVVLTIEKANPNGQVLSLPNWIAGSYKIRDFAKNISQIKVISQKTKLNLKIKQLDKNHWLLEKTNDIVKIYYQVYAFDLSVRSAYLTNERAFFNGSSVFLMVDGQQNKPCNIEIHNQKNWTIHTTIPLINNTYIANNYQQLIDCPVEMAKTNSFDFMVNDIKHTMAISGKHSCDNERIKEDITKVCAHHQRFFSQVPFEEYLFLLYVNFDDYGGLEHKNSTSLICPSRYLPQKDQKITPEYTRFLALCSHEYFHAWWVKTLKPIVFKNMNLDKELYTEQLWIFEGFTSYYDELSLLRTNLLSLEQYLNLFAESITRVYKTPGRHKQTITNSSFETWTKFYQQNENSINSTVSYYTKGAILAFVLDIKIRQITNNLHSLDDVLKIAYKDYKDIGLKNDTIQNIVNELTNSDFSDFFHQALYTTKDLELAEAFAYIGINFKLIPAKETKISLGLTTKEEKYFSKITTITNNSAAQKSGLYVNDVIIAIDDMQVNFENFTKRLQTYSVEQNIKITVFRNNELKNFNLICDKAEENTCSLTIKKDIYTQTKHSLHLWQKGLLT